MAAARDRLQNTWRAHFLTDGAALNPVRIGERMNSLGLTKFPCTVLPGQQMGIVKTECVWDDGW